jgi:GAF domain-containing protein
MSTNDYTDSLGNQCRGRASLFFKHLARIMGFGEQRVYYGLVMAFGLLFVLPSLGFIDFAFKYNFFADRDITYYFLFILVFSYLGFFILRSHADRIRSISENLEQSLDDGQSEFDGKQTSELNRIVFSFHKLIDRLEKNNRALESRAGQLRSFGEIMELSPASPNPTRLLKLGLQKACQGVAAGRGWVLLLDESRRHHFRVACEVDTKSDYQSREGVKIGFSETRAKDAVIQRIPKFLNVPFWQEEAKEPDNQRVADEGISLVVPLITGRDVFGVICLEDKQGGLFFSPADLEYLLPMAAFLSYRYENIRLRRLIATQSSQYNCLAAFNNICTKGLVQGKVFQLLIKELRNLIPVTVSFLALFENAEEQLKLLEVASTEPISLRRGMALPLRQSLLRLVLEENREIYRQDVTGKVHPLEARWFCELGINSCYLAPFRIQGVNAGILFVGSDSKGGFSHSQRVILKQAGDYLGLAVHNQILLRQIDEQGRELEAFNRIGNVVTSSLFDLDDLLGKVGTLIGEMITVEAGAIYLRDKDGLAVKKSFGTQGDRIKPFRLKRIEGICGYVMSRGESVLVRDASQNPHLSSLVRDFGGTKARSILCVPMMVGEEVIGAIHMWNKEHGSFTSHDNKLIRSVAASLATAIAGARFRRMCHDFTADELLDDDTSPGLNVKC